MARTIRRLYATFNSDHTGVILSATANYELIDPVDPTYRETGRFELGGDFSAFEEFMQLVREQVCLTEGLTTCSSSSSSSSSSSA